MLTLNHSRFVNVWQIGGGQTIKLIGRSEVLPAMGMQLPLSSRRAKLSCSERVLLAVGVVLRTSFIQDVMITVNTCSHMTLDINCDCDNQLRPRK